MNAALCRKKNIRRGFTLIELTVIIVVKLILIIILFFTGKGYIDESNRANCLAMQNKIKKTLISYGNLKSPLEEGVEYYADPKIESAFGVSPVCPETGGGYSVTYTAEGSEVAVICLDREESHQHK